MMSDMQKAKEQLVTSDCTCVLRCGERVVSSTQRGVKPLVGWIEGKYDLNGFSAADKVVGKATAFLYVLLGIRAVYAHVISEAARRVLEQHGIPVEYGACVAHIINRQGNGICPFEAAVWDIDDATAAYAAVCRKMQEMAIRV